MGIHGRHARIFGQVFGIRPDGGGQKYSFAGLSGQKMQFKTSTGAEYTVLQFYRDRKVKFYSFFGSEKRIDKPCIKHPIRSKFNTR